LVEPATEVPTVVMPPLPLAGGCQCGRVRYLVSAAPLTFYLCHCRECQRHTSSAFGESLRVAQSDFSVTGVVREIRRVADSGVQRQGWFCPECGVRLWHGSGDSVEINVKAGTLYDTAWLRPAGHIWVGSRQPFIEIHGNELAYAGQPEDSYAALKERWKLMTAPHR
jgi:hypothetical protein